LFNKSGTKIPWENFIDMLTRDDRMGDSHMQVPGTDSKQGFGGHCFPKDTEALLYYAKLKKGELGILKTAIDKNKKIRK
jgi:UDPglucose 6-dehydrogenase